MSQKSNYLQAKRKNEELWAEIETWKSLIKGYCVVCRVVIRKPVKNYFERGNYCFMCNLRFARHYIERNSTDEKDEVDDNSLQKNITDRKQKDKDSEEDGEDTP